MKILQKEIDIKIFSLVNKMDVYLVDVQMTKFPNCLNSSFLLSFATHRRWISSYHVIWTYTRPTISASPFNGSLSLWKKWNVPSSTWTMNLPTILKRSIKYHRLAYSFPNPFDPSMFSLSHRTSTTTVTAKYRKFNRFILYYCLRVPPPFPTHPLKLYY